MAPPRPIAIVMDYLGSHHSRILSGVHEVLGARGWSTTIFIEWDRVRRPEARRSAVPVYGLLDPAAYSGILGVGEGVRQLQAHCPDGDVLAWAGATPFVSIAQPVPGAPAVVVDNRGGMDRLLEHLFDQHGFRAPAFVRGLRGVPDSDAREAAFHDAVRHRGLRVPAARTQDGLFSTGGGAAAVRRMLAAGERPDLVVAASDDIAFGVVQALREFGLRVPEDVAVTGYDDGEVSPFADPPLTTVSQPFEELGRSAAHTLLERIDGGPGGDRRVTLPTRLVVRGSCGGGHDGCPVPRELPPFTASLSATVELAERFFAAIEGGALEFDRFSSAWREGIRSEVYPPGWWLEHLRALREASSAGGGLVRERTERVASAALEDLLVAAEEARVRLLTEAHRARRHLHDIGRTLVNLDSVQAVVDLAEEAFATLPLRRCFVALYPRQVGVEPRETPLRLQIAYLAARSDPVGGPLEPPSGDPYPSLDLLPPGWRAELHRGTLIARHLEVGGDTLGLMLIEPDIPFGGMAMGQELETLLDFLQHTLASAFEGAMQREALRSQSEQLERLVGARTRQLEREVAVRRQAERELIAANTRLLRRAREDGLTGLANRTAFDEQLVRDWHDHRAGGSWLALVMCDIDAFKRYNDHYGHVLGDACLQRVADVLLGVESDGGMAARYGGEEFVLILRSTDPSAARNRAEALRHAIHALQISHAALGDGGVVTASFGVAALVPDPRFDPDALLTRADAALYRAKRAGRNRVALAAEPPAR